ncbi:MAG: VWA domain-containing protein [Planctomycetota bacterium]
MHLILRRATSLVKWKDQSLEYSQQGAKSTSREFSPDEPRGLVVVVHDTSGSMLPVAMESEHHLEEMVGALKVSKSVARRFDLEIVTAGGVPRRVLPFTSVLDAAIPNMVVGGGTPLCEATLDALASIESRIEHIRSRECVVSTAILVVISDGGYTDTGYASEAKKALREAAENVVIIPFLTAGGDESQLSELCGCNVLDPNSTDIPALFQRLTSVIRVVSQTSPSQVTVSGVRALLFDDRNE